MNTAFRSAATASLLVLAACGSVASEASAEGQPVVPTVQERAPTLRQGRLSGYVPPPPVPLSPGRLVPVNDACRGSHLMLDAALSDCACTDHKEGEREDGSRWRQAGTWCGLRHPNEVDRLEVVDVRADRDVLARGEGTRVTIRARNPGTTRVVFRILDRHGLSDASLVLPNGDGLPDRVHGWMGNYREEALVELEPGGTVDFTLSVDGSDAHWDGSGDKATAVPTPFPPGRYAIRVGLGLLDRARTSAALVPVTIR